MNINQAEEFLKTLFNIELLKCSLAEPKLPKFIKKNFTLDARKLMNYQAWYASFHSETFTSNDLNAIKQISKIASPLKVNLICTKITEAAKKELHKAQIGYICPPTDVYFPDFLLKYTLNKTKDTDLQQKSNVLTGKLSPLGSYLTSLYLKNTLAPIFYSKEVLNFSKATASAIGKATEAMQAKKLIKAKKEGRAWIYEFMTKPNLIWAQRQALLCDPIRSRRIVSVKDRFLSDKPLPYSGESALSIYTLLSEPQIPSYAIPARQLQEFEEKYLVDNGALDIILDVFYYPPTVTTLKENHVINELDLVLSRPSGLGPRVSASYEEIEDNITRRFTDNG